jgi:hypothetical protein
MIIKQIRTNLNVKIWLKCDASLNRSIVNLFGRSKWLQASKDTERIVNEFYGLTARIVAERVVLWIGGELIFRID